MDRGAAFSIRLLLAAASLSACGVADAAERRNGFVLEPSLVPVREIRRGGPPRDGIPAIYTPRFLPADGAHRLRDDDRVIGVVADGVARAYPVAILDHHEVVNDWTRPTRLVITYCPLCGSGMVFRPPGDRAVFGVSGLLYNSDVLLYDHQTESLWSQILGKAVTGPAAGEVLEQVAAVHGSWSSWRARHPDTLVLSRDTGYRGINYASSPYAGYERTSRLYFPVSARDKRLKPKAWVLGVSVAGNHKAYPLALLAELGGEVHDELGGVPIVLRYRDDAAWAETSDGELLAAVRLYWFAWYAFHPDTALLAAQ